MYGSCEQVQEYMYRRIGNMMMMVQKDWLKGKREVLGLGSSA
jgi:hypothetical protein